MKYVKLREKRYRQLKRRENTLVTKVKPLVERLHRITRQHKLKKRGFYGIDPEK